MPEGSVVKFGALNTNVAFNFIFKVMFKVKIHNVSK